MHSGHAKTPTHKPRAKRRTNPFTLAGLILIGIACAIVSITYWPLVREELGYSVRTVVPALKPKTVTPIDPEFGIVIPKIGANARIIAHVDPFDSAAYQKALTRGVAHAKGSHVPGDGKNTFLFAHSSMSFYDALRYNSVFYLLNKLERDDEILVYYHGIRYPYRVIDVRFLPPSMVQYLFSVPKTETVTLMTCWPPGTTAKRLIVIAERAK